MELTSRNVAPCIVCFFFTYVIVAWLDCFVGHSCPGGFYPESCPLSLTCDAHKFHRLFHWWDSACPFSYSYFSVVLCLWYCMVIFCHLHLSWYKSGLPVCIPNCADYYNCNMTLSAVLQQVSAVLNTYGERPTGVSKDLYRLCLSVCMTTVLFVVTI